MKETLKPGLESRVHVHGHRRQDRTRSVSRIAGVPGNAPGVCDRASWSDSSNGPASSWSIPTSTGREEQTVGTHINMSHTAATPPGMNVTAHVKLVTVDGRRLVFEVEARDEVEADREGHPRAVRHRQEAVRREDEQEERHLMQKDNKGLIILSLATLYIAWSSTYLAIRVALEGFPPFFIAGFRYMLVGAGIYLYLRRQRERLRPPRKEWGGATVIGVFLLLGGTAGTVYAEQWVGSGMAALVLSTSPLLTVLFAMLWKHRPARNEWLGMLLGRHRDRPAESRGRSAGASARSALLILASASWSFGSVLSLHVPMPRGMMASATQMFAGGLLVLVVGFLAGEQVPAHPSVQVRGCRGLSRDLRFAAGIHGVYLSAQERPARAGHQLCLREPGAGSAARRLAGRRAFSED